MKKILFSLFALLTLASLAIAVAPALTTNVYDQQYVTETASAFDTLVAVDSTSIYTSKAIENGWEYAIMFKAATGTGADSVASAVCVDVITTTAGTVSYRMTVDTLTTARGMQANGQLVSLGAFIGSKFNVKLLGITGQGTQVIINKTVLYKRRPLTTTQSGR